MRLIQHQNPTVFLCLVISLLTIQSNQERTYSLSFPTHYHSHRSVEYFATSLWLREPASKLEAQMYFYMQPTARKIE